MSRDIELLEFTFGPQSFETWTAVGDDHSARVVVRESGRFWFYGTVREIARKIRRQRDSAHRIRIIKEVPA